MKYLKLYEDVANLPKHKDGKVSDEEGRGYIMYRRYDDGIYVMMGSYTDPEHRGKGIFKTLFDRLLDLLEPGETIQAAACSKILAKYLQQRIGFKKIKGPVRYWGNISNGVNLEYVKP
jgi:GNAT superfamily N-acetyltransferase